MIITSEITGKQYKTVDACVEDERKFIAAQEAERKKREGQKEQYVELNKKVEASYEAVKDAWKNYKKAFVDAGVKLSFIDEVYLFLEVMADD